MNTRVAKQRGMPSWKRIYLKIEPSILVISVVGYLILLLVKSH